MKCEDGPCPEYKEMMHFISGEKKDSRDIEIGNSVICL